MAFGIIKVWDVTGNWLVSINKGTIYILDEKLFHFIKMGIPTIYGLIGFHSSRVYLKKQNTIFMTVIFIVFIFPLHVQLDTTRSVTQPKHILDFQDEVKINVGIFWLSVINTDTKRGNKFHI